MKTMYKKLNWVYSAGTTSLCPVGVLAGVGDRFVLAEGLLGLVWV